MPGDARDRPGVNGNAVHLHPQAARLPGAPQFGRLERLRLGASVPRPMHGEQVSPPLLVFAVVENVQACRLQVADPLLEDLLGG